VGSLAYHDMDSTHPSVQLLALPCHCCSLQSLKDVGNQTKKLIPASQVSRYVFIVWPPGLPIAVESYCVLRLRQALLRLMRWLGGRSIHIIAWRALVFCRSLSTFSSRRMSLQLSCSHDTFWIWHRVGQAVVRTTKVKPIFKAKSPNPTSRRIIS